LYHLPTELSWKQLDLAKPSRAIQLNKEHIHDMVVDDDGSAPFIAIATEDHCVHIVKFTREKMMK